MILRYHSGNDATNMQNDIINLDCEELSEIIHDVHHMIPRVASFEFPHDIIEV